MYPVGKHPMFPYTMEDRKQILELSDLSERQLQTDVNHIKEWYSKQPHLPIGALNVNGIETLIIASKGSLEKTKRLIDFYFRYRTHWPEIYQRREELLKSFKLWNDFLQVPMPKLYDGKRIIITKFTNPDIASQDTLNVFASCFLLAEVRMFNDLMLGDIWIIDAKDCTMLHAMKMNPLYFAKAIKAFKDGLSIRIFGIYFLNCNLANVMQFVLMFFKPLLSKKLFSRVKFHESYESFHEDIPKEYLSKDYGGDLPSVTDLRDEFEKVLRNEKTIKFLKDASAYVADESKRPKDEYNEDILPGTFKKLELY